MNTLVFGTTGQIADSLREHFPEAKFVGRETADFTRPPSVRRILNETKPQLVINAAAYTAVDKAEIEPGLARMVNSETPSLIAEWCKSSNASLIHYSTDYVYAGSNTLPQGEDAQLGPQNEYGKSKLLGEQDIADVGCHAIILRTSWIYAVHGKNFVKTMVSLGRQKKELSVVADQVGSPTYAPDVAQATAAIARHARFKETTGVFNLTNTGFVSWYEFAEAIFDRMRSAGVSLALEKLHPIPTAQYPSPAKRPLNSRLDISKIKNQFAIQLRPWDSALDECIKILLQEEKGRGGI